MREALVSITSPSTLFALVLYGKFSFLVVSLLLVHIPHSAESPVSSPGADIV